MSPVVYRHLDKYGEFDFGRTNKESGYRINWSEEYVKSNVLFIEHP